MPVKKNLTNSDQYAGRIYEFWLVKLYANDQVVYKVFKTSLEAGAMYGIETLHIRTPLTAEDLMDPKYYKTPKIMFDTYRKNQEK